MVNKIMELTNIKTFWEDVRHIVGYYEGRHLEDWQIKECERWACYRYEQLKESEEN